MPDTVATNPIQPRPCPECGYDTTGLSRCPECGVDADTLILRANWREWRIDPAEVASLTNRLTRFTRIIRWYVIWPIGVFVSLLVLQVVASLFGFFQTTAFELMSGVLFAIAGVVWLKLFVFERLRLQLADLPSVMAGEDGSKPIGPIGRGLVWLGTGCAALLWGWVFLPAVLALDFVAIPMVLSYTVEVVAASRFPHSARWQGREVMKRKSASLGLIGVPLCFGVFVWEAVHYTPANPATPLTPRDPFGNTQLVAIIGWLTLFCSIEGGARSLAAVLRRAQRPGSDWLHDFHADKSGGEPHEKTAAPEGAAVQDSD